MTLKPNEHVTAWIGAYYDGELAGALLRQVEDHLGGCTQCQAELEALGALSSLLHADPSPAKTTTAASASSEVFASRVMLRLPREQKRSMSQRVKAALPTAWRYAPAGLFIGWAFFQAALLVSAALIWLMRVVPQVRSALGWLMPLPESGAGGWLNIGSIMDPMLLIDFALTAVTVALFAAWLASWWAIHHRSAGLEGQNV